MRDKQFIAVALPPDPINKASAREKSIRYGHPSSPYPRWARRPRAVARADCRRDAEEVPEAGGEGV